MTKIKERLDLIIPKIQEEKFLTGTRLGNEIAFYIFDYNPKDELLIRDYIKLIKKNLKKLILILKL